MRPHSQFPGLFLISHPLVLHKLSLMRSRSTGMTDFRQLLREAARLIAYEVTRDLPLCDIAIETPMGGCEAPLLKGAPPAVIAILRAGLGMAEGVLDLVPDAPVGHIGSYRDHATLRPVEYLIRLPEGLADRDVILVDPMLATGGSAVHALDILGARGAAPARTRLMALVAAPEGVAAVQIRHPQVRIFAAALDSHLNADGYIVPGLGDAGDRQFGTM